MDGVEHNPPPTPAIAEAPSTPTETREPVAVLDGVSKTFRSGFFGRRRVHAVRNLSLTLERGEVFGLLGPNGSGKSTTVKMLLGLLAPTSGSLTLFGRPPTDVAVKHRLGFLPEESYLYRFLNADETLDFFGKLFDLPKRERRRRADALIAKVGLAHARKRPIREYSKGMTRRIGLAQALINNPEFLVLDEPTSGLDPIGIAEVKELIAGLRDEGKTILLCSHLLADVEEICDRVAILFDGELLAMGTLDDLLAQRDALEISVRGAGATVRERLEEALAAAGIMDAEIRVPKDSLADVFLGMIAERDPTRLPEALRAVVAARATAARQ